MTLCLISAVAKNGIIGNKGQLPWSLPDDLKHFKEVTLGKPVIMGDVTFESLGRPLPGRTNIVMTLNQDYDAPGVKVVHSKDQALAAAKETGADEVFIIGGSTIYKLFLDQVQRMYLTEVQADVEGDASFPDFDRSQWQEISRERHTADERHAYPFDFVVLEHAH